MRIPVVSLWLSALFLGACAQTAPYRVSFEPCEIKVNVSDVTTAGSSAVAIEKVSCPTANRVRIRGNHPYELAFVEIDEQGYLADRRQAELAVEMAGAAPRNGGRVRVVVYVHGWHHNASADDDNIARFHVTLAALSRWNPQDTVRGIYVGWRGDSLAIPGLRFLTFWDRKNTSDEVGRGSLYEVLMHLERAVKGGPSNSKNHLVLVGHSFGASVVFNSLGQLYMQRFIEGIYASAPGRRFRGYGDMVVLVNPAIEAMRYMPFHSALRYFAERKTAPKADFSNELSPVLIILSSEGDWATRTTFPGARFFSTVLEAHRGASITGSAMDQGPHSEWVMDVQALGNYQGFNTHEVIRLTSADRANRLEKCSELPEGALAKMIRESAHSAQTFPDSEIVIRQKPGTPLNLPYWHADLGTEIVKDHSQIKNLNLVCWVSQLIEAR